MALTATLCTTKPSPYYRPPELQIKVLLIKDQARVIAWEFRQSSAVAKTTKNNRIVAITDGETVTKITIFEEFSSKITEGKRRAYGAGESPPLSPVLKDKPAEGEGQQGPPHSGGGHCASMLILFISLSAVKKVRSGREEVPLRELKLRQDTSDVTINLWRDAAVEELVLGSTYSFSHLTSRAAGGQLQSTAHTNIKMVTVTQEAVGVEVLGVAEGSTEGQLEVLLSNGALLDIQESLWEPFEACLEKARLYVTIKCAGRKNLQMVAVQKPSPPLE
ncbi:uncharacterized protein LOC134036490 [Osmerus eperlanus]|uniref:uncharacterized protein LOC134036490 n=1 Tax=Osmerus eperlanus TaxID=29151 RepID=UPI002E1229C8